MLSEPVAVMLMVTEVLESLGVPYIVGGSLASAMYGTARATMDADIVADVRMEHAEVLAHALADAFYVDVETIRDAIRYQSSFNVIHLATMFRVDVFVPEWTPFNQSQLDRRVSKIISADPERTAYFASPEDIVLAKLQWYQLGGQVSDRQWQDVLGVLSVQGSRIDVEYMLYWAARCGIADLLQRALKQVNGPE